ncbi:hypothetical protein BCR36DRAFT_414955 [Piromyces finnis]|uniref:TRP C-terminal domain-containing protein n=1 Tax=Piromyces finnis TaxID=1754191 RepID=A0A1Y1V139_9FUNG|nr:hypothetical protein BCR36DRAFT_414955 [Piromyces finnis]|eukprot:ORX44728.1 hypothetical protein BCR36DRAFT_414955 [Piromyces finnis]
MNSFNFISSICLFIHWSFASFFIFEAKSEIDFNEDKQSLHINSQYQYYTVGNVDIPGVLYNYDSIVNYNYLDGYIDKFQVNSTERCHLTYNINYLYNHEISKDTLNEISFNGTSDKNVKNVVNKNYIMKKKHSFNPENFLSYSFKSQTMNNINNNTIISDAETTSKKNITNLMGVEELIIDKKELTVTINHAIKTLNINKYNMQNKYISNPIVFINYNDIVEVGCSLYEIITLNHWNDIINANETLNMENKQEKENNCENSSSYLIRPSLIALIVNEKDLYNIKMESNANKIGIKYAKLFLASTIPITFISRKEYANLIDNSESKELWIQVTPAPTSTTIFQYQNSTKIGHIIGTIGSIFTFTFALYTMFSKLIKNSFSIRKKFKFHLNSKIIFIYFFASLLFVFSWIIKTTFIYQEVAFITSPIILYIKEIITNYAYLLCNIGGSLYISCLLEKFKGINNAYYDIFLKVTNFIIEPIIIIVNIFINNMDNVIIYYIYYISNILIIIIISVQAFLYLSSGKYIYHLLITFYEEQEDKNYIPITSIDNFIEHHKLNKNTFYAAPSLCYLYFFQLLSFIVYKSFYESGIGFWIILITQLLFINTCIFITLFIFSQKYSNYKLNREMEKNLKILDNNKWYLAVSKRNIDFNSIPDTDINIKSKFNHFIPETSYSQQYLAKNNSNYQIKDNLYVLKNNSNSNIKTLYNIKKNSNQENKNNTNYLLNSYSGPPNQATLTNSKKSLSSSSAIIKDINSTSHLNSLSSCIHNSKDLLIPSITNIPYTITASEDKTPTSASPSFTSYSSNKAYHFPSVFEQQPSIDFTSRYKSLITTIKPRNSCRDIYSKGLHEKKAINNYNNSVTKDQSVLYKKNTSYPSCCTDIPNEIINTFSKQKIKPSVENSISIPFKDMNQSINMCTIDTPTIIQSNTENIKDKNNSSNVKINILSHCTANPKSTNNNLPVSIEVEPERKIKKIHSIKKKLLKSISTLTISSFDKEKNKNSSTNQIEKHNKNIKKTLNFGSSSLNQEINSKNKCNFISIPINNQYRPLFNNIYSTKKDIPSLKNNNDNNDDNSSSCSSSGSSSIHTINFDIQAMSTLLYNNEKIPQSSISSTLLGSTQNIQPENKEKEKIYCHKLNNRNIIESSNNNSVENKKEKQKCSIEHYQEKNHKKFIVLKDDTDDSIIYTKGFHNKRNFIVLKEQDEDIKNEHHKNNNEILKINNDDNYNNNNNNNLPLKVKYESKKYVERVNEEQEKDSENIYEKGINNKLKKKRTFNNLKSFNYFNNNDENIFSYSSTSSFSSIKEKNSINIYSKTSSNQLKVTIPKAIIINKGSNTSNTFTKEPSPLSNITTLNILHPKSIPKKIPN